MCQRNDAGEIIREDGLPLDRAGKKCTGDCKRCPFDVDAECAEKSVSPRTELFVLPATAPADQKR